MSRQLRELATDRNPKSNYPKIGYFWHAAQRRVWCGGRCVKEQYIGDINDFRKYALLRVLSGDGRARIGVCWMLTPSDGTNDGRKLDYLQKPERWRAYDPPLFDLLKRVAADTLNRRIDDLERSGIIPGARF